MLIKKVQLWSKIHPMTYCNWWLIPYLISGLFQSTLLCAGVENGKQRSCRGDSGGPLMHWDSGKCEHFLITCGISAIFPLNYFLFFYSREFCPNEANFFILQNFPIKQNGGIWESLRLIFDDFVSRKSCLHSSGFGEFWHQWLQWIQPANHFCPN